jgi:hypothetical protein
MMVVLLIAGIGLLLAGVLTVGFGIQVDLSFGNTLILSGTVAASTGMIMLSLWAVARELKRVAWRLGSGAATEMQAGIPAAAGARRNPAAENGGFLFSGDQQAAEDADELERTPPSLPWQEEEEAAAPRERGASAPEPAEAAPAVKPRRNLLFSSSSRKERERAQGPTPDPAATDPRTATPPLESDQVPPVSFDDAWPRQDRARADAPPQRRGGRRPAAFTEANAAAVTVLKSGVVDGMAYSLYSDGSIEAQMPEGMMRFTSINELRAHLDQRP